MFKLCPVVAYEEDSKGQALSLYIYRLQGLLGLSMTWWDRHDGDGFGWLDLKWKEWQEALKKWEREINLDKGDKEREMKWRNGVVASLKGVAMWEASCSRMMLSFDLISFIYIYIYMHTFDLCII